MKKFITFITAVAIFYDFFSPLRLYFEGGKALLMLIPTLVIIMYDRLFLNKAILPISFYVLTCALLMVMGCEYFTIPQFISYFFAFACFEHFVKTNDYSFAKVVLATLYITLMLTVAISIPLFISMPNLSRLMLESEESGITDSILYWTISYQTIHALPIYSIPLFYLARTNNNLFIRLMSVISIVAILVLMFFADATTPLIITLSIYFILLIYNPQKTFKQNSTRLVLVGVLFLVLMNKTVLIGILRASQFIFVGSSTYNKVDEIIMAISGQGTSGDMEAREDILNMSLNSFFENPFFPEMNINKIGQHNFFIDQFVALGLFLGVFLIWFLVERIKRPLRYMRRQSKPLYWLSVAVMLAMGLTKNYFLFFPTCCVVPMLIILSESKIANNNK